MWVPIRAQENLKLAGNWPKVAAMCSLRKYKKKIHISSFQTNYPYYCGCYAFFWAFISIWLATSISVSSFWQVNTYFWSYLFQIASQKWLSKSQTNSPNNPPLPPPPTPSPTKMPTNRKNNCRISLKKSARIVKTTKKNGIKTTSRTM